MNIRKYFDGMYLGDGMLRVDRMRKTTGEPAYRYSLVIREEQEKLFRELYHDIITPHTRNMYSEKYGFSYKTVYISNDGFCRDISKRLGISGEKHLEEGLSEEDAWSVLSGFLDTDGNVDADKISLCNTDLCIIHGIKDYLDKLGIAYTVFTQKTKNKTCYWVRIPAEELPHTKFELLVPYKRERYEYLKTRSRGRKIDLGKEWFESHKEDLVRILPKTTRNRRYRNSWYWLSEYEYSKL